MIEIKPCLKWIPTGKRLKLFTKKVVAVAYERRSFTRRSNWSDFTGELLMFWGVFANERWSDVEVRLYLFIYLFVYSFIFLFTFHLASSPRDKRRADRDSLDLPPSLSPPPQLPGSQPPPYGMLPPQYQHLQNHMGPMMAPPQFQPQFQPPLNHIDSGEIPMDHGMQSIDECMMRPQQFNPADIGGYPTTTNHNGQNHLELMHDMINSF